MNKTETIETGIFYREAILDREQADEEGRTVELAFSSEAPVERGFGIEVLDHDPGSVRLERIQSGGPLLVDHNPKDHVGIVEDVSITGDRKGRALVRFGRSARATEVFNDVMDGIRRSVSVGYVIHRLVEDRETSEFRAVDWEPYEVSLVSIPADTSVGVGRSDDSYIHETVITREFTTMESENKQEAVEEVREVPPAPSPVPSVDVQAVADDAARQERERIRKISEAADHVNMVELGREFIRDGKSVDAFAAEAFSRLPKAEVREDSAEIGLTDKERREYSFTRAIRAQAAMKGLADFNKRHIDEAGFELECHEAATRNYPTDPKGIIVPDDVLRGSKRDLQVAVGNQGGNLVAEDLLGGSFIELLRNNMVTSQLGVRNMDGLVGDIAIPKHTAAATAYWVSEGSAPTESTQTIGQIGMTPKTLGAFTDYTRKLLLQSSVDVERFVRDDFARVVAIEMDRVVFYGLGASGEPKGIQQWADVNTTSFSTSATPTWAEIVDMEGDVAADNALMGSLAYVTHPTVRANMKTTSKAGTEAIFVMGDDGRLNGYDCLVSTQVTNTHVWFGNWADAMVGRWGGVDILVDPYTASTTGTIRIVIFQSCDVAVRHGQSFSLGS